MVGPPAFSTASVHTREHKDTTDEFVPLYFFFFFNSFKLARNTYSKAPATNHFIVAIQLQYSLIKKAGLRKSLLKTGTDTNTPASDE